MTRRGINISGVDFWHAVEFSRNGRFLCNRLTGSPPGASLRSWFPTLSDLRDPISSVLSRFPLLFRGFLSGGSDFIRSFRVRFPVGGCLPGLPGRSDDETLADSRAELIIGPAPFEPNSGMPKTLPKRDRRRCVAPVCLRMAAGDRPEGSVGQLGEQYTRPVGDQLMCRTGPPGVALGHDDAYVYTSSGGPPDGGRPHVCIQRPPLRRPFSYLPPPRTPAGRDGGPDQKAEDDGTMTRDLQRDQTDRASDPGQLPRRRAAVGRVDQHRAESLFCVVDLHALTVEHDPARVRRLTRQAATLLLASGLDPERVHACSSRAMWTSTRGCPTSWSARPPTARCGG